MQASISDSLSDMSDISYKMLILNNPLLDLDYFFQYIGSKLPLLISIHKIFEVKILLLI